MSNRERGARSAIKYYQRKDRRKLRAFNHDFVLPKYFQELIGDKKSVLIADLGAGSICTLGNQWPGVDLTILASDLLADEYNEHWRNTKRTILNPVTKQDMEALTYPDDYFDIVHCVNALDHCEHPQVAIKEGIRVCKPGGWVYFRHIPNEGQNENYHGFHQWNIDISRAKRESGQGDDAIFWSRQSRFLLSEFGAFVTEIKTEISNTMYPGEESVVSKLQKPASPNYKSYMMGPEKLDWYMSPEGLLDGEIIVGDEVVDSSLLKGNDGR